MPVGSPSAPPAPSASARNQRSRSHAVSVPFLLVCLVHGGCASPIRITEFERGTLFSLEQITHHMESYEDFATVCGTSLVYDTDKDGQWEIYIKPAAGRETVRKTSSPAADYSPTADASCSRIAFVSVRDGEASVYVVAGREASAALRIGPGLAPAFTRDGSALYYQRFLQGEGSTSIWRYDFGTNQHTQLVNGYHPAPSPDGRWLAYAKTNERSENAAIWLLDLTSNQEQEVIAFDDAALILPVWSPDGQSILLTINYGASGSFGAKGPAFSDADIAVVKRDGTGFTMLTDNPSNDIGRAWDDAGNIYFSSLRDESYDIWRFKPSLLPSGGPEERAQ